MSKSLKLAFAAALTLSVVGVARGESYDTSSYVQEGLIAHWDACENAGYQKYDATSATWKDVTAKHADLVFPNGCVMGKDANGIPYYNLAKDAQGNDHGCYLTSCADIAQAIIDKACTVEIVCDFASQSNDGTLMACVDGNNNRILWARSYSGTPDGCLATLEYFATSSYEPYPSVDGKTLNQIRGYSLVCGATKCDIYKNGETTGKSVACKNVSCTASSAWLSFGRRRSQSATSAAVADMKIYAIRIYNRILNADEMQKNFTVDYARLFQAQLDSGHNLFIQGDPDQYGTPDPEYGVYECTPGEERTCTASDSIAEEDRYVRTCFGYQLYTNTVGKADEWLPWGEAQVGHSVTFTFPEESNVKLVWKWIRLRASVQAAYGGGADAVCVAYNVNAFSEVDGLDVSLRYGASPVSQDRTIAGSRIVNGGAHAEIFRGLEQGRRYWGRIVFSVGEIVVFETETFSFATTDMLAYWPLNSRTSLRNSGSDVICGDQSGNGFDLSVNREHVVLVSGFDAPDGEFARADGTSAYLKTLSNLPFSAADGLTFFLRIRGLHTANASDESVGIFETSLDFNSSVGAVYVYAKRIGGQWYLCVSEHGNGWWYAQYRCTTPLSDSDWQNVVIVFTKQDAPDCFAVYLDGVRQTLEVVDSWSNSMKGVDYCSDKLYIGGRGGSGKLAGDIDEFSIYGYAMDADGVAQLTDDMTGVDGTLFVESADGSKGASQPLVGAHSGFAKGQVVAFERDDFAGVLRTWSIFAYDEARGEWGETCRGYGRCGTFRHTGGKMRLSWNVDTQLPPVCRWTFNDGTGRNDGTFGADCDLEFSGATSANGRYLSVPKEATAYAVTKAPVPLASANGLTASFWVRNPQKRTSGVLLELSPNFNNKVGTFLVSYASDAHKWTAYLNPYSLVGYSPSEEDDTMLDGEWHHCTVVYNKRVWPCADFYIDGVKIETDDAGSNMKGDATNFIFADNERLWLCHRDTENSTQADLDDVTIHPYSLAPTEVAALYVSECIEKNQSAPDDVATLVVTAKKHVPKEDLPIPGFGRTCACTAGEKLSFDFTRAPYSVEGRTGKFKLMSWKLYRYVDGEWTVYQTGTNPLVEFVHPGGAVKLELNFDIPGLIVLVM